MPDFSKRSYQAEIMDDLSLNSDDLRLNLDEIDIINRLLGGNVITIKAVEKLLGQPMPKTEIQLVDLGCGSGTLLKIIHNRLKNKGLKVNSLGIDANPNIIEYAKRKNPSPGLEYKTLNIESPEFENLKGDIFLSTLFLHHFGEAHLIKTLNLIYKNCSIGLVVNDLERNRWAYYGIEMLTSLFSKSHLTQNDAKLSVLRGFSRKELEALIRNTDWKVWELNWKWAFRWGLILKK